MNRMWAIPELYIVKIYTNLQQVYEYQIREYSGTEAKNIAITKFNAIRLTDETITNVKVFKIGLKAF